MITIKQKGDWEKTIKFLKHQEEVPSEVYRKLDSAGQMIVSNLQRTTPVDTGVTASSWRYEIVKKGNKISLNIHNDNIKNGVPIAIILQYGHGTRNYGYVQGRDYINPAVQPIFDKIAKEVLGGDI